MAVEVAWFVPRYCTMFATGNRQMMLRLGLFVDDWGTFRLKSLHNYEVIQNFARFFEGFATSLYKKRSVFI